MSRPSRLFWQGFGYPRKFGTAGPRQSTFSVWLSLGVAVRLLWEIAQRGFRRYATYRTATLAGAFTNTVFGFIRAYVLLAVYQSRADVGGFNVVDAITYVFLTQALLAPVDIFSGGMNEIGDRIQTGDIVTDFYRPVNFQLYWLASDLGRSTFQLLFRGVPPFVVGILAFNLTLPSKFLTWIAFLLSATLAVVISFGVRFAVSLSGFWLLDTRGALYVLGAVMMFFSGFLIPLTFFPPWLETLSRVLPFAAIVQVPIEIFLGKRTGGELGVTLIGQLLWVIVLLGVSRAILAKVTRRVVVQGG